MTKGNAALRERLNERVDKQKRMTRVVFFIISLAMFVLFALIAGVALGSDAVARAAFDGEGGVAVILPFVGWAVSIMYQGIALALDTKANERKMLENAVTREMQQRFLAEQMGMLAEQEPEKPKRRADALDLEETPSAEVAQQYELGDDGEIRPVSRRAASNNP